MHIDMHIVMDIVMDKENPALNLQQIIIEKS